MNQQNYIPSKGELRSSDGCEKQKLLSRASCFILASLSEAFPMTLLEAISNGIPCIISEDSMYHDLFHPSTYISAGSSIEKISAALHRLFNMSDHELNQYSKLSSEYASLNFSEAAVSRILENNYALALKQKYSKNHS